MSLSSLIQTVVRDKMKECDSIYFGKDSLEKYFAQNNKTIKGLYDLGVIDDDLLEGIVIQMMREEVKLYINYFMENKNDYFLGLKDKGSEVENLRPEILAFAIDNNDIGQHTLAKISFAFVAESPQYYAQVNRLRDQYLPKIILEDLLNLSSQTIQKHCADGCNCHLDEV